MNALNLFLSVLAFLIAGLIVYFQYYHKQKINSDTKLLSLLRFLSLFCILILLINPKFEQNYSEIHKPSLLLGIDNSSSITHLEREEVLNELRQFFLKDKDLNDRFDIEVYKFGAGISTDTLLSFEEAQTDIYKLVDGLNALAPEHASPIVLLTDGNQTYGRNYAFMASKNPVFPIVIGDTLVPEDIGISRVNVNAYASLDNNFEVELFLNSNVKENINSKLVIERNGINLYTTNVSFTELRQSVLVNFFLSADTVGMQLYKAKLIPFKGEKNVQNNNYNFGVEILDEQSEVVIVYNVLHPDLGMLKRSIETNKQRKASLIAVNDFDFKKHSDAIVILYQPDLSFTTLMDLLEQDNGNYLIITGRRTDWEVLNTSQNDFYKKTTGLVENVFPIYKNDFSTFYTEDLGYQNFPPLLSSFGDIEFNTDHEVLLSQKINDLNTSIPLLVAYGDNNAKRVVLFGEGIWKWRAESFRSETSFDKFDLFFNSLIQYLQLKDRKQNMDLFYDPVYNANETIRIQVKNYDRNLNLELDSQLILRIDGSNEVIPFYVRNNLYEVQLSNLEAGTHKFEIEELGSDKKQAGSFIVVPFSSEQESQGPNVNDLRQLARQSGGIEFFENQVEDLKIELLQNQSFKAVQKQRNNLISLIDWKWILGLIVLSLSLEWLLRKYRGMI